MSRPNKKKIATDGGNAAAGFGLSGAFEKLGAGFGEGASAQESQPEGLLEGGGRGEYGGAPVKKGRVVLRRETAHRGGKCVVVLDGFDPSLGEVFLATLAKRLRAACGCGGSLKGRAIELQGEQVRRAREFLTAEGFRVAGVS